MQGNKKTGFRFSWLIIVISLLLGAVGLTPVKQPENVNATETVGKNIENKKKNKSVKDLEIPQYKGELYTVVNNNQPFFTKKDMKSGTYEHYSKLDRLGRVGVADSIVGKETMPVKRRGDISKVKPTGWHQKKYDFVNGKFLYNRSHLIGFQLSAENDNACNLMTGTRTFNAKGMLPFENMVADYIKSTGGHVRYRVTPVFEGNDLVAKGVYMEARSVEDNGEAVEFNVFVFNAEPGVTIDYATGYNKADGEKSGKAAVKKHSNKKKKKTGYVKIEIRANKKSKIYHMPGQEAYDIMGNSKNLVIFHSEKEAMSKGYRKAKR